MRPRAILGDSGVGLGNLVSAGAWDDTILNSQRSAVATGVTSCDGDLAVGGDGGEGRKSDDEELGEYFEFRDRGDVR
ncbi:unnamed protein product [Discula destructiva]